MANGLLKFAAVLVLLHFPTLGLEEPIICESFIEDDEGGSGHGSNVKISGRPGEIGPKGDQGPVGLPGVPGSPGDPGRVDYDKISQKIEERINQVSRDEMNGKLENMQSTVEEMLNFPEIRKLSTEINTMQHTLAGLLSAQGSCRNYKVDGVSIDGKFYFAPVISETRNVNFKSAMETCYLHEAELAEFRSINQQNTIANYFRTKVQRPLAYISLWIGMTFDWADGSLVCRSSTRIWHGRFDIAHAALSGAEKRIVLIIKNGHQTDEGLKNVAGQSLQHGMICQKEL